MRHHLVVRAIQETCHDFHMFTSREPSFLHPTLRPDLVVAGSLSAAVDVSVVDPLSCASGDALEKRALDKRSKYDPITGDHLRFFPVCLEVFGTVHHEAEFFLRHVARDLHLSLRSPFLRRAFFAVQQALLVGNARVVRQAAARLLGRSLLWLGSCGGA
jgi:hypothetical protein